MRAGRIVVWGVVCAACLWAASSLWTVVAAQDRALFVARAAQPLENGPWERCDLTFINVDARAPRVVFEDVPVALDQKQRSVGLKTALTNGSPIMLFLWDDEDHRSFWMKDVGFPLALAFVDGAGRVSQIEHMQPESTQSHQSDARAMAAIEVVPPTFGFMGVEAGSQLQLSGCSTLAAESYEFVE